MTGKNAKCLKPEDLKGRPQDCSPEQIRKIVDLQVGRLRKQLEEKNIQLDVTNVALSAIATEGYDPSYGARPLKRVIQQRIQNPLAVELLKREFTEGSRVKIDYRDGEFTFERMQ